MTVTSTRSVTAYDLSKSDDREQLGIDHAKIGWTVSVVTKPGDTTGTYAQQVVLQISPTPMFATFDDVVVSDLIASVQVMTRDDYNAANPDNPLSED